MPTLPPGYGLDMGMGIEGGGPCMLSACGFDMGAGGGVMMAWPGGDTGAELGGAKDAEPLTTTVGGRWDTGGGPWGGGAWEGATIGTGGVGPPIAPADGS